MGLHAQAVHGRLILALAGGRLAAGGDHGLVFWADARSVDVVRVGV